MHLSTAVQPNAHVWGRNVCVSKAKSDTQRQSNLSELKGKLSAFLIFFGFNATFFPQFLLGWLGMPRRYHTYPDEWVVLNVMSTAGAMLLGSGFVFAIGYMIWSLFWGKKSSANPWGAKGLEWEVCTSPPEPHNFHGIPIVNVCKTSCFGSIPKALKYIPNASTKHPKRVEIHPQRIQKASQKRWQRSPTHPKSSQTASQKRRKSMMSK